MTFRRLLLVSVLLQALAACQDDAPAPTDDTDQDLLGQCVDPPDRARFEADHLPDLCAFAAACPDSPFSSAQDCVVQVTTTQWDVNGCWDDCRADRCALWLRDTADCTELLDDIASVCNTVSRCE